MKRNKKGWLLFVALVTCTFGTCFWFQIPNRRYVVSKETTYYTAPLLADGRVDYLSALNNIYGTDVTTENNALVPLLQVISLSGSPTYTEDLFRELGIESIETSHELIHFDEQLELLFPIPADNQNAIDEREKSLTRIAPWTELEHPDWAAILEQQTKAIDIVVEASRRSRYFEPLVLGRTVNRDIGFDLYDPVLSPKLWTASRSLYFRAMFRLGNDEVPGAIEDLKAARRLSNLLDQSPLSMDAFISDSIRAQSLNFESILFASENVSADQLKEYLAFIRQLRSESDRQVQLKSLADRLCALDLITYVKFYGCRSDDPAFKYLWDSDRESAYYLSMQSRNSDVPATMQEVNRMFDELQAALETDENEESIAFVNRRDTLLNEMHQRQVSPQYFWDRVLTTPKSRASLLAQFVVCNLVSLPNSWFEYQKSKLARDSLTELAICIELFKRETGSWPESLSVVSSEYIAAIPQDPYANDSIQYQRTADGYVVYSAGPDGIDNKGIGEDDLDEFGPTDIRIRVGEVVK